MIYSILIHRHAQRQLAKLPWDAYPLVRDAILRDRGQS